MPLPIQRSEGGSDGGLSPWRLRRAISREQRPEGGAAMPVPIQRFPISDIFSCVGYVCVPLRRWLQRVRKKKESGRATACADGAEIYGQQRSKNIPQSKLRKSRDGRGARQKAGDRGS